MKIKKIIIVFLLILIAKSSTAAFLQPMAKVTAKAVDSKGQPVIGASVTVEFLINTGWGSISNFIKGKTDKNGEFTGEGQSLDRCTIGIDKDGFYSSDYTLHFNKSTALNRWEPWNPTVEVALKEIKNPVAMYAKKTGELKVPILEKPVGYDFEKGDWVTPYGNGVVSDFVFICKANPESHSKWECSYKLIFSNPMDGIFDYASNKKDQSVYDWPYDAPEVGYKSEINWSSAYDMNIGKKSDYNEKRRYIFRVRTKTDEKGNITSAYYGKIKGDIRFFAGGYFDFEYYFNPSGSKNLEYDPKKSLFKWKTMKEIDNNKVDRP